MQYLKLYQGEKMTLLPNKLAYILVLCILVVSGISCSSSSSSEEGDEIEIMIEEVRNTIQDYHNFEAASEAGWAVDMSGCVEHPEEGGMGHHYARPEYVDGRTNHVEPQILLFEPLENGGFELVGVEYIIPFDVLPADSEPPSLFDEDYHQNHELDIWALHVWTEKENPKGMFYDWNPNVSCEHAASE